MTDLPELAISVHAPWAWALMHAGKDVENRSHGKRRWPQSVLGRVWVHASRWPLSMPTVPASGFARAVWSSEREKMHALAADHLGRSVDEAELEAELLLMRGHIVGSVEVYGYRTPDDPPDSPWYVPGSLAILVRDPRPLATPVRAKGALGWWRPQGEVLEQLKGAS